MASPNQFTYPYPRPSLTVDVVLWAIRDARPHLLLIERDRDPFAGSWALPGGFVDELEPLEEAARREMREETGVELTSLAPVGMYGDPGRDPRGWTVSAAYYALVDSELVEVVAGDDARTAAWHSLENLPKMAFDHERIVQDAWHVLRRDLSLEQGGHSSDNPLTD